MLYLVTADNGDRFEFQNKGEAQRLRRSLARLGVLSTLREIEK